MYADSGTSFGLVPLRRAEDREGGSCNASGVLPRRVGFWPYGSILLLLTRRRLRKQGCRGGLQGRAYASAAWMYGDLVVRRHIRLDPDDCKGCVSLAL
jgi:hypothetical protein